MDASRPTYSRPYLMHGSIGPSAAMALWEEGGLEIWTHSQGPTCCARRSPPRSSSRSRAIRVRHVIGPGCYGHNGADDAAFDAALLARACPGRAVLLKWSRADEHRWEPYGAPGVVELRARARRRRPDRSTGATTPGARRTAAADDRRRRRTCSPAATSTRRSSTRPPDAVPRDGGRDPPQRDADLRAAASQRIVKHFVAQAPLRTSSLRSLGAYLNVFAIESFIDELAALRGILAARVCGGDTSPTRAPAPCSTPPPRLPAGRASARRSTAAARGSALARYKNSAAYAAVLVRLRVDDASAAIALERIVIAADCGEVVDPSGAANQLEGGALQSASWTLKEAVAYDGESVTSVDWETYPILRFSEVPAIETVLLDRPGQPFLGVGEATQGPTAAAIGNAVFDATGLRLRDTPFTPERVRDAAARG